MIGADQGTSAREALARARSAVASVRALLSATERVLAALEMMLVDAAPNVVVLRRALDAEMQARRAADESLLLMSEAADRLQDSLGAGTRLVVIERRRLTEELARDA